MEWVSNLSIKYKVLLIGLISSIGFALYLALNFFVNIDNARRLDGIRDVYYPVLERADANINRLDKVKQDLTMAVTSGEESLVDEAMTYASAINQAFDEMGKLDVSQQSEVTQLKALFASYTNTAMPLTRGMIKGSVDMVAAQDSIGKMGKALKDFEVRLGTFRKARYDAFENTVAHAQAVSSRALIIGVAGGVVMIALLFAVAFFIASIITKDIVAVSVSLREMSSGGGDLTRVLKSRGNDEVGELVQCFNAFADFTERKDAYK